MPKETITQREILEYIEASNNVIDSQNKVIAGLKKQASEAESRATSLTKTLNEEKIKSQELLKKAQDKTASASNGWGKGETKGNTTRPMKESERILMERFGTPRN